ncbi:MAG: hypothetical protein IJH34_05985 [Romboutsia sp.]|nr:hypothetical protein [Romboutsia sp.]
MNPCLTQTGKNYYIVLTSDWTIEKAKIQGIIFSSTLDRTLILPVSIASFIQNKLVEYSNVV